MPGRGPSAPPCCPPRPQQPRGATNYTLSGVTRDSTGAALGGCVVRLFMSSVLIGTTTSDGSGNFSFAVSQTSGPFTYEALARYTAIPALAGVSADVLVPNAQGTTQAPSPFTWNFTDASSLKYFADFNAATTVFSNTSGSAASVNNGTLARVNDRSSAGLFPSGIIQATGGNQPIWKSTDANMNGRGSMSIGVADKWLAATFNGAVTIPQPYTICVAVYQTGSSAAYHGVFDGIGATYPYLFRADVSTQLIFCYSNGPGVNSVVETLTAPMAYYVVCYNGVNSYCRKNGLLVASGNFGSADADGVTIGAQHNGFGMEGSIGEIAFLAEDVQKSGLLANYVSPRAQALFARAA